MSVRLRDNLYVRKKDAHTKNPSWFANTKVYSLPHILVVVRKRETEYEDWDDCVSLTKRNNLLWRERERNRHGPWIIFQVFSRSSNTCMFIDFVFIDSCLVWDTSWERSPKWRQQRSSVFTSSRPAANQHFPFFFYPTHTSLLHFYLSSFQNLLSIRYRYVSIFSPGVPNYFTIVAEV